MSIFPKRTTAGKNVTIHWNFNTVGLKDRHIFPYVRIGVKDPLGNITMLFEDYVLGFPDEQNVPETLKSDNKLKYLNKNVPLLVLADYLKGPTKREVLIDILKNIQAGRHYYFSYRVSKDAVPGKYVLISELYNNGRLKSSKTQVDDHFWVEKISLLEVKNRKLGKTAVILNNSIENTPVKLVRCTIASDGTMKTSMAAFEMRANERKEIFIPEDKVFLTYNEEREVLYLGEKKASCFIKNQQLIPLGNDGLEGLLKRNNDEAYQLSDEAKKLWRKADGLMTRDVLEEREMEVLEEMIEQGLINQIQL